jgi:5,10-methylenetetrahydromethanopterin reductase
MKLAISWVNSDINAYGELAEATERAGFGLLGCPDTQTGQFRNVYVSLTLAAMRTQTIQFGPWVTNAVTRHPAVTAAALGTLAELAPGRVVCAFGTGDSGVFNLGLRPAKLSRLGDYITTVRELMDGQEAEWDGGLARVGAAAGAVPLYLAAGGPKTLELAGRVADGAIVAMGLTAEAVNAAYEAISRGAEGSGRDPNRFQRWWWARVAINEDRDSAVSEVLPALASAVNDAFRFTLEGKGVPEHLHEPIARLQEGYDFTAHNRPGLDNPNALLARKLGLADYLTERFGVVGSYDDVVSRIRHLETLGVDGLVMRVHAKDRLAFLQDWAREIMPRLEASRPR